METSVKVCLPLLQSLQHGSASDLGKRRAIRHPKFAHKGHLGLKDAGKLYVFHKWNSNIGDLEALVLRLWYCCWWNEWFRVEDHHTHALFPACQYVCVCVFYFLFLLLCFSLEWDYWAGPLCQLYFQLPLDSYQGRECEIMSHCGDCPLALSHAPLQHLISTILMPCATTEILYRQREIDGERTESLEATTRTCSHLPIHRHTHTVTLATRSTNVKKRCHQIPSSLSFAD